MVPREMGGILIGLCVGSVQTLEPTVRVRCLMMLMALRGCRCCEEMMGIGVLLRLPGRRLGRMMGGVSGSGRVQMMQPMISRQRSHPR